MRGRERERERERESQIERKIEILNVEEGKLKRVNFFSKCVNFLTFSKCM